MEPERPIERLLRETAKKRRGEQGGDFVLPPATRRVLQGEVARVFGKKPPEPVRWYQAFSWLRPRIAWALALLLGMGIVLAVWVVPRMEEPASAKLTWNEPSPAKASVKPAPAAPAAAPTLAAARSSTPEAGRLGLEGFKATSKPAIGGAGGVAGATQTQQLVALFDRQKDWEDVKDKALAGDRNQELEKTVSLAANSPAPAPMPVSAPPPSEAEPAAVTAVELSLTKAPPPVAADYLVTGAHSLVVTAAPAANRRSPALAFGAAAPGAAPASVSAPPAAGLTVVTAEASRTRNLDQFYSLTQPAPARTVLASFQMEKSGQKLRIIDRDGSVYSGYLEPPKSRAQAPKAGVRSAAPATDGASGQTTVSGLAGLTRGYYFHVAGTNRSLKQRVVFTGNIITEPNSSLQKELTNAFVAGGLASGSSAQKTVREFSAEAVSRARITGKAKIGNQDEIEINAVRTPP
jgi:hypothetical protein